MSRAGRTSGRLVTRAALALALLSAPAPPARADVLVESDETGRLTATNAPLGEVLAALRAKFPLRYGAIAVEREINGTIEATTLHRVVVRLLDGFDFVVSRSPEGVEIVRVAPRGTANFTPPARPGATEWKIPAAQAAADRAAAQSPR